MLNLAALREFNRRELVDILDSVRGRKALVLDQRLSGPLSLIAEYSLLKDHGVEKVYYLTSVPLQTTCDCLLYFTYPSIQNMTWIANQVKSTPRTSSAKSSSQNHYLYFIPYRSAVCERVLEEEGVYGDLMLGDYHLDLIPLDTDLLSFEYTSSFKELYLEGDYTCLQPIANSLMKLQAVYGLIPRLYAKGRYAVMLTDMLERMMKAEQQQQSSSSAQQQSPVIFPEIDCLIVVDRECDLITPLLTQLTYEGMLDEQFGVQSTFIQIPQEVMISQQQQKNNSSSISNSGNRKVPLNSTDPLYARLRGENFANIGILLNQTARRINQNYQERHAAKTVTQLKEFVGRLGGLQLEHQSLNLHTNLADYISKNRLNREFRKILEVEQALLSGDASGDLVDALLDQLLYESYPLPSGANSGENGTTERQLIRLLRLLSLQSQTTGGLRPKQYEQIRLEILHSRGFNWLPLFDALERMRLLYSTNYSATTLTCTPSISSTGAAYQPQRLNYGAVKKSMRLVVDDVDETAPLDIAYTYSGYAPLSCRLVEWIVDYHQQQLPQTLLLPSTAAAPLLATSQPQTSAIEEQLRPIAGPFVEITQRDSLSNAAASISNYSNRSRPRRTRLILFLGGCTFSEVAAIRFMAEQQQQQQQQQQKSANSNIYDYKILTTSMINGSQLINSLIQSTVSTENISVLI